MPSPVIFVVCFQAEKRKITPDLRVLQDVLSNPLKKESLIVHLVALVNFNASLRFATIRLT